jgi:alanine dehydrogenase
MKIAVPREIKKHEYRVGLTPANVIAYVAAGHEVKIELGADEGAGFTDAEYLEAGASMEDNKVALFDWAEMIVKVKGNCSPSHAAFPANAI